MSFEVINESKTRKKNQDVMPKALLHKDLGEASFPASFYRKPEEIGTDRYSIKDSSEGSCAAVWLFYNCRKHAYGCSTVLLK